MTDEPQKPALDLAPDPYQAEYMAKGALYYDKIRAPRLYHLIFAFPLLVSLVSGAVAASQTGPGALVPTLFSTVLLALAWLLFSVLRITVTREEVYVQYGLFGPKIAVRDIVKCEAVSYDWKRYGGFGIRYGRDGSVAYNMMGDGGRAVEIVYKKGDKEKKILVASPDPVRLAAAVNRARGEVASQMQIEAPPASITAQSDAVTREAEAEAEAILAQAEADAKARNEG